MNYSRWYEGDYLRDTLHLTWLEDLAYRRLLGVYYSTEQALPTDRKRLYALVRASSKEERKAVERILAEFFHISRGKFVNNRAKLEVEKYGILRAKRVKAGKERAKQAAHAAAHAGNVLRTPTPTPTPTPKRASPDFTASQDQENLSLNIIPPKAKTDDASAREYKLKIEAKTLLRKEYPAWQEWQLDAAIETVSVNAFNSGATPKTASYFVTGVRNLTTLEIGAIENSLTEQSFRAFQSHTEQSRKRIATLGKSES